MIWELTATVCAAFGAAGLVLMLRPFWRGQPKWLPPAAAGLGMMAFQIYGEYTWFEHTRSRLPPQTVVVAEAAERAPYKPWSYLQPQVLKFIAADTAGVLESGGRRQVNLYFFERRLPVQVLGVWVDCRQGLQAEVGNGAPQWGKTAYTDRLLAAVCR